MTHHTHSIRIYWEDTDAGGIVYYANYFKFAERARTEWLRAIGVAQGQQQEQGGPIFVVKHCTADFQAPAKLDDEIVVMTQPMTHSGARLTLHQTILRGDTVLVDMQVVLAAVTPAGRATRLPAAIIQLL